MCKINLLIADHITDDDIERDKAHIIAQDHSVQRKYLGEGVRRIEIKVRFIKTIRRKETGQTVLMIE